MKEKNAQDLYEEKERREMIKEIYYNLQETDWLNGERKISEEVVMKVAKKIHNSGNMGMEEITGELFEVLMSAEEGGFHAGFKYAVNLILESMNKFEP